MPDLLFELFSEEIPARMQARAAEDLRKAVTDRLVDAGLVYEGAKTLVTPRRLALAVHGLPARQPDAIEERKGPRVGAPDEAITGFLKATGLKSISEAKIKDLKKGEIYVAEIKKPGRLAIEVLAEILPAVIRNFPWPKSMHWGSPHEVVRTTQDGMVRVTQSGEPRVARTWLSWVRPLHSIVATFGPETEEPEIVPFAIDGVAVGNETCGHRFMAPAPFSVRRLADYLQKLEKAKVVPDAERRRDIILTDARQLAFAQGFELVEDEGLLTEVAGLVEWPVVLMGAFDQSFLHIPEEVIRATIRNNQKCFVLRDAAHAKLVNKFILVSNIEANDGGAAIVAGNERVIRARLSDAKFFYETDLKNWTTIPLEERLKKFRHIVFHEKLGTQAERIERIERLAVELAPLVGADVDKAKRAARLCKADLLTEVVGEFPELQGLMGRYYAEEQGEDESVAHAIEDHYKPKGPSDLVPSDPVAIAVALADKIDTLVEFWAIGEKPTGSKDPYALRRTTLGIIRLIIENRLRINLSRLFALGSILPLSIGGASEFYYYLRSESPANLENEGRKYLDRQNRELQFYNYDQTYEDAIDGLITFIAQRRYDTSADVEFLKLTSSKFEAFYLNHFTSAQFSDEERKMTVELASKVERLVLRIKELRKLEEKHSIEKRALYFTLAGYSEGKYVTKKRFEELYHFQRSIGSDLLSFFADRLKVQLRDQGARHDLVDAVFALGAQDDLLLVVYRVEALGKLLDTEDGKSLLAGFKRAANIIRIEEKKDGREYYGNPDKDLYVEPEERALARAINSAKNRAKRAVAAEDFEAAMRAMAKLRPHVDAFFDKVTVNVEDKALRENRLKLLNEIRAATRAVADFSRIEG